MALDPVPLAIGNGAQHTDEVWRTFANAATRDSQGIVLPGQFKVTALSTPGEAVNVAPGGLVIRNAQQPGESYIGRALTTTQVSIARNNSGAVRRDLIIARIIDPDFAPWQPSGTPGAPNTSVANGPYFELVVISGVASNVTRASQVVSYSAVALARVDVVSTASGASPVTNSMIVDCRELAQARVGFAYDVQRVSSTQSMLTTDTSYKDWPNNSLQVYVPRWATHAQVGFDLMSVKTTLLVSARIRVVLGGTAGPDYFFDVDGPSGIIGSPFPVAGEFNVQAVQDSFVTLKTQAMRLIGGGATGTMYVDTAQYVRFDVRFSERAV